MGLNYTQWTKLLADCPLPAAVVDLDRFDENVASIAAMVGSGGPHLRLATKSIRVPDLIRRILDYGPPYRGLMTFSAGETRALAVDGFDDFLLAYPTPVTAHLEELREVHEMGKKVAMVVDSLEILPVLEKVFSGVERPFPVIIEVDMSLRYLGGKVHLGVRRSPIRSLDQITALLDQLIDHRHLALGGIMAYEAQVAGLGDRNPFKKWLNPAFSLVRKASVRWVKKFRRQIARVVNEDKGRPLEIFNGGGTGSLTYAADEPWLTEVTAGSGFLCPHLFDYYSNLDLEPAAFFALPVVRRSDSTMVTCLGGGYVASGEPGWDKVPVVHLPKGIELVSAEGTGEVQTPLALPRGMELDLASPVIFRHAKGGELAERFDHYHLVRDGKIFESVPTYRGRSWSFF